MYAPCESFAAERGVEAMHIEDVRENRAGRERLMRLADIMQQRARKRGTLNLLADVVN